MLKYIQGCFYEVFYVEFVSFNLFFIVEFVELLLVLFIYILILVFKFRFWFYNLIFLFEISKLSLMFWLALVDIFINNNLIIDVLLFYVDIFLSAVTFDIIFILFTEELFIIKLKELF